ncbi:MAG: ATP-binding protein, partial [Verrucomicrobiota bacterium]
ANKHIETMLGYNFEERKSKPSFWKSVIHPDDRERIEQKYLDLLASGGQSIEKFRWIAKDGRVIWVETQVKVIYGATGKPIGLRGVTVDISERLQLEAKLRQSQKMESIGQLAGGIAHDFNNILTVIQGHGSLLRSSETLTPLQSESLEQITLAGERATNLTRQLLTFSRRQVMQTRPIDLNEVVTQFTKLMGRVVGEDVAIRVTQSPTAPIIHADIGMMEQLLMNLAVNSRDAMPKGGALTFQTATVLINHAHIQQNADAILGEAVCLTVSDTGTGISPENLPRIYEPFFTTKAVGKGSGLGLATVYGIVKQHSGWISAQSEIDKGTSFQVFFPISKQKQAARETPISESPLRGGTETILIVEDEAPLRNLVHQILQKFGYTVMAADSGISALKLYKQNRDKINLLLTDMIMPDGMTGRELAEIVQFDNPEIKVIFTSGYNAEIVGKDFSLHEGLNFVQKPYHPKKLAKAVRDCLDNVRVEP